ncbi:MAG: hypothetical protein CHKLHMKO_00685 [Candidatus Argoarchaeum ethanivorans]|uniref:Uncharacterized protein n=1 Tax=Candidatus Argoarchaeum ethanivorans TaxID=2608793 RepID=A0A811TFM7_9EURY|nr:MAG: hypothetical protein CHKLHMKO_00685 [Candidatus Argoarchaeum ethanivorans]
MGYEDMTPEEMDKDTDWDKGWGDLIKAETVTLEELKEAKIPVLRERNKLIITLPDEFAVKLGTKLSAYFNADKTIIIKEK